MNLSRSSLLSLRGNMNQGPVSQVTFFVPWSKVFPQLISDAWFKGVRKVCLFNQEHYLSWWPPWWRRGRRGRRTWCSPDTWPPRASAASVPASPSWWKALCGGVAFLWLSLSLGHPHLALELHPIFHACPGFIFLWSCILDPSFPSILHLLNSFSPVVAADMPRSLPPSPIFPVLPPRPWRVRGRWYETRVSCVL